MRRRLVVVFIAMTSMIAIAFVVPLGALVRDVARDRAIDDAKRAAASIAPVIAVTDDPEALAIAVSRTRAGAEDRLAIHRHDDSSIGAPLEHSEAVVAAFTQGRASTVSTRTGAEVVVPVIGPGSEMFVVHVVVPDNMLRRGVTSAWLALGTVALAAVCVSVLLADRFARSVTRPVSALAEASNALGSGDVSVRVEPSGPAEVEEVGRAFNVLAGRVEQLLTSQREDAADLAHRLRTPLAALRLQLDQVPDDALREQLSESADSLARGLDRVIAEARRVPAAGAAGHCDLIVVARERTSFWGALAEDQGRTVTVDLPDGPIEVPVGRGDLAAMLDVVLENVFAHTDEGVGYAVSVVVDDRCATVVVSDEGPGFDPTRIARGVSDHSTGLGLDIARRTVESAGGAFSVAGGPGGRVEMAFPVVA